MKFGLMPIITLWHDKLKTLDSNVQQLYIW